MKIDRVSGNITFFDFLEKYLIPNRPCIIDHKLCEDWEAVKHWQCDGIPNFDYLHRQFGSVTVSVADCSKRSYSAHPKEEWTVDKFLHYWKTDIHNRQLLPVTEQCDSNNGQQIFYLKDWHYARHYSSCVAYKLPLIFSSDWLNEYWASRHDVDDDYKFVYMGPKGSWTPFHADVLRSFSWSTNICGCKEWIMFPPGEEDHMRDKLGTLPFDVGTCYPDQCNPLHVIQHSGETIFVPSGWHHQVRNLEDTISINHNWSNACNLDKMFQHLKSSLEEVKKEISDCMSMDGWNQQCQLILKATCGMDYVEFCDYLLYIGETRLQERDDAFKRLKGVQSISQTAKTRSCDMSCNMLKNLTSSDIKKQQSQIPLLHQYLPDSITSLVLSTPVESKDEQYCSDLAVAAYRNYELGKIESVLKELLSNGVLDDFINSKQKVLNFLQCLNSAL